MKPLFASVLAFLALLPVAKAAPNLTLANFLGSWRIVRCTEYLNGAMQPGTDICASTNFPQLQLAAAGGGYEVLFLTAGGGSERLPALQNYRNLTQLTLDQASFGGTEMAAYWERRKTWNQTGQLLRNVFVTFSYASDGTPTLMLNDLDSEAPLHRQLRRHFTLRRISF